MDPQKIQAIAEMKAPPNLQDLQSYLGLVTCFNRFSSKLADLRASLRALCEKEVVFARENSRQETFEAIRKEITMAPVPAYFDKSRTSVIQ